MCSAMSLCLLALLAMLAPAVAERDREMRLIGYFDAKSQKELSLASLNHENLTHLVLTNAVKVDNQGNLVLHTEPGDLSAEELIAGLAKLPLKLVISLRGHEDDVALDELSEVDEVRTRFAASMAAKLKQWGASGLEIEWHSDDPNGGKATTEPFDVMEQYHFALLCRDLAIAFRSAGSEKGNMSLSVAVRPGRQEFNQSAFVNKYIDWLALRAYSMRSLGDPHHSSLKDMATAIDEWQSKGVSKDKIVLGTALFGRPGAALHTAGDRNEALRRSWRELTGGHRHVAPRDDRRGDVFVDVGTGKAWWVSGLNTTRAKVKYVVENGYGGLALRDLHQDGEGELSLRQAAADAIKEYSVSKLRRALAKPLSLLQKGLRRSRTEGQESEGEL
eukprot:gb/GFBE01067897.1/.p1 GENE.gb/GFBE01067897.1/~~gb/GFBE01067897.1/.p1  ORF type:complete len:389 (+),score=86.93 gb/GFBE01067897.1/:1-1167(+)